jgi:glycine cleavage system transcriptional repressor
VSQLIVTAVGPDRPGLVGELSTRIYEAGGNILDSRMANLQGQFALILLLEASPDSIETLSGTLPGVGQTMGLSISVARQTEPVRKSAGVPYVLKTYSLDQPGILARISNVLRDKQVNIEDLTARQESAPFAGNELFTLQMTVTVPPTLPVRELRAQLEQVCAQLNCDFDLEPA